MTETPLERHGRLAIRQNLIEVAEHMRIPNQTEWEFVEHNLQNILEHVKATRRRMAKEDEVARAAT